MYTFREIWGNGRLIRHLRSAVQNNRTSHAYLFIGGAGAGKKLITNTFAKYLLCSNRGDEPCGVCESCRVFDSGNHPDVIHVTSPKKTLGVDEIRGQILETVDVKPYHYEKKVYILHAAHTMTVQAQNALLKTLEEPPAYAVFLLLAETTELFLPTVLSRTVTLKINPLTEGELCRYLVEKDFMAEEEAAFFAAYGQGRIGHALALLEDEAFRRMREDVLLKMSKLPSMRLSEALLLAKEWEGFKNDPRLLDIIGLWYRDLMIIKAVKDERFLIQKDKKKMLYSADSLEGLAKKAAAVTKAKERLMQNANFRLTLEVMLMELKENEIQ